MAYVAEHHVSRSSHAGVSSGVYGLAFIGSVIYYLQHATTFWEGVVGVLKAIVWPAMITYQVLDFLNK